MSKEQSSSYVMNEEIHPSEKQKNNHTIHDSSEVLRSFRHNVSHLDEMIKRVNGLEKDVFKNTDIIGILNTLLQKSDLGGSNGGKENKAYFKKHDEHIVLVLNTVVNGERLSSIGDIEKILTKVDELLIKNPLHPETVTEKKEGVLGESIQKANNRLSQYERQIQETNASYREDINDWYMLRDAAVETFGGESGKKIYEKSIQSIQKNMDEDYKNLLASFSGKAFTPDDVKKLHKYQKRLEDVRSKKLEDVQSFAGYLVSEKKMDSLKNGVYAIKGMAEGAFEAFSGTAIFLFLYTTNPQLRDNIHSSIGGFYDYLKKNYSNYDVLWKDFLQALDKEFAKFQGLPSEQQAEAIGKMTGNIMATIIGAKGMNAIVKSGKLRLKFKPAEIASEVKAPSIGNAVEQANHAAISPKKGPKVVTDIGEVKTWKDLESFTNTIDRIRFKEGVTGKVIGEIIDEVRLGTRKISDVPEQGGLRAMVKKLKDTGGVITDPVGRIQKGMHIIEQAAKKGIEVTKNILPFKEARKFLHKKILTGYDHIDLGITKLRTLTSMNMGALGDAVTAASHIREMQAMTEKMMESVRAVSFPGKEALLENLEGLSSSLTSIGKKGGDMIETIDKKVFTRKSNLTKKELQALRFEEGFAVREIQEGGTTLYEYRGANGKKIFEDYTYASNFRNGQASVTTKEGKNLTIDTTGKSIAEHTEEFSSIQQFENGGYRVFEKGFYRIAYPEGHKGGSAKYKSQKYAFMTDVHGDMVIGVDEKGTKYIINQKRERFVTPFHYVDDFTEHGVAAVQDKLNGKWLLIDKKGNLLRKDGSMIQANGKIVDGRRQIIHEAEKIGESGKTQAQIAKEARTAAFEEGYTTNLEAIKAHMKKLQGTRSPEVIKKIEADAMAILKKNGMSTPHPMLSHTQREGILLFEDPVNGTRIINIEKGTVSKEAFSYVHTPDIEHEFIRVSPLNYKKHMGVIDLNGEYMIEPRYANIQIHDDAKKLFEVSEIRKIGDVLKDGTIITHHSLDTEESMLVERVGLVDGEGKTLIETGYMEIAKKNDTISQGLTRSKEYKILDESQECNTERYRASVTKPTSTNFDTASFVAMSATEAPTGGKVGGGTLNVLRDETSTILSELSESKMSLFINGASEIQEPPSLRMQIFLQKKIPLVQDIGVLRAEVEELIHEDTTEYVKKYLEKNRFSKLTKTERLEVADYEKETREKFMGVIRSRIRDEETIAKGGRGNERDRFMNTLVDTLRPDVYVSLGGTLKIKKKLEIQENKAM